MARTLTPVETLYVVNDDDLLTGRVGPYGPEVALPEGLTPLVAAQVQRLVDGFDDVTCDAAVCATTGGAMLGWYLTERETDYGTVPSQQFNVAVVVENPTRAYLLCEDCSTLPVPAP